MDQVGARCREGMDIGIGDVTLGIWGCGKEISLQYGASRIDVWRTRRVVRRFEGGREGHVKETRTPGRL